MTPNLIGVHKESRLVNRQKIASLAYPQVMMKCCESSFLIESKPVKLVLPQNPRKEKQDKIIYLKDLRITI